MMHRRPRRGSPGCRPPGSRRFDREEWLARLERYQRDLEQETADVADLIRRLKEPPATETTPRTA